MILFANDIIIAAEKQIIYLNVSPKRRETAGSHIA
jgi:hypothetical protein